MGPWCIRAKCPMHLSTHLVGRLIHSLVLVPFLLGQRGLRSKKSIRPYYRVTEFADGYSRLVACVIGMGFVCPFDPYNCCANKVGCWQEEGGAWGVNQDKRTYPCLNQGPRGRDEQRSGLDQGALLLPSLLATPPHRVPSWAALGTKGTHRLLIWVSRL